MECLSKFLVVLVPSGINGVLLKLGQIPFSGLIDFSSGLYSSSEKADTGAFGVILVAKIYLLCSSLSCLPDSLSPIFLTWSSLILLNLIICSDSSTLVFTLKTLLSTTTFALKSSISFYYKAFISTSMSSPLMNTVLKNSLFENVVTPLTFLTKSGLPSSYGRYTLSCNLNIVSYFCK